MIFVIKICIKMLRFKYKYSIIFYVIIGILERVNMLKIAICDDELMIASKLEKDISDYQKKFQVEADVSVFFSGEKLIKYLQQGNLFDLIFLDIELGTTTGIDVGKKIREELNDHISKIVFITSKTGYESSLFDIQPLNFLRKPIDLNKLYSCIDLTIKLLNIDNKTFEYKKQSEVIKVQVKDIMYVMKEKNKVHIVTSVGQDEFYDTIDNTLTKLPNNFIKTHAAYIINFDKVASIDKNTITMINGEKIPVSQRNLKDLRNLILESENF